MNGFKEACLIAICLTFPVLAWGDEDIPSYFGFELGSQSDIEFEVPTNTTLETRKNGTASRLYGGYYSQITDHFQFGVEAGINMYKRVSLKSSGANPKARITRHGIDVLAMVNYSPFSRFSIIGKAGVIYFAQKTTYEKREVRGRHVWFDPKDQGPFDRQTAFLPEVVLGTGFKITENQTLGINYHHIFGRKKMSLMVPNKFDVVAVNTWMVFWQYTFPDW